MKHALLIICCCLFFHSSRLFGQKKTSDEKIVSREFSSAVEYAAREDYDRAIKLFRRVREKYPNYINVHYNLGLCYLNSSDKPDSAVTSFETALELLPKEDITSELGIDLQLSLGKANQMILDYDAAEKVYEGLLELVPEDLVVLRDQVSRELEVCGNARELIKQPVELKVINLGASINSKYDDHSPLVSVDESVIFFTSRRASSYSELLYDGQYTEKIYSSQFQETWKKPHIFKTFTKNNAHEASVGLSVDGTELFMFRNDINGKNLYISSFDGDNWSEPQKMPNPVNSQYDETHATISSDRSMMLFTSNRPGGFGGLDIYEVRRLPNGEWGKARNIGGNVNSRYDEETPMLHPDGKTLYFSSEGHNSMGSFDIFYSQLKSDSTWRKPVNIGYPISTPDDDFFFVPTAGKNRAYYASSKFQDNYGGSDLYLIEYKEPEEATLAVLKGEIAPEGYVPLEDVVIEVRKKEDNELIGEYRPNPGTGKYVMILAAGQDYQVRYTCEGVGEVVKDIAVAADMIYEKQLETVTLTETVLVGAPEGTEDAELLAGSMLATGRYTVQILALKSKPVSSRKYFAGLESALVKEYACNDDVYRYAYGRYATFKEAKNAQRQVFAKTAFQDAFIRMVSQYDDLMLEDDTK